MDRREELRQAIEEGKLKYPKLTPGKAAVMANLHPKTVYDFLSGKSDMQLKTFDSILDAII